MKDDLSEILKNIDGSGSDQEYKAIIELKKMNENLPILLLKKYKEAKKWGERAACVYHSISYARDFPEALQLGIIALTDKSKVVVYRACMLLAYSLKREALFALQNTKENITNEDILKDINAAIDAIENQNSNFFVDRDHSGKISLKIPAVL